MEKIEVHLPSNSKFSDVDKTIEKCCKLEKLKITMKGTLSKYPGCIHWHVKKDMQKGTLEITLWEKQKKIWFSVHSNRNASWTNTSINLLKILIKNKLV